MSMRQVYRKIAKEHGVTPAEVKRDMQAAIGHAYQNTPADGVTEAYQKQIPRKGKIPTAEEVIRFAAQKVKDEQKK